METDGIGSFQGVRNSECRQELCTDHLARQGLAAFLIAVTDYLTKTTKGREDLLGSESRRAVHQGRGGMTAGA